MLSEQSELTNHQDKTAATESLVVDEKDTTNLSLDQANQNDSRSDLIEAIRPQVEAISPKIEDVVMKEEGQDEYNVTKFNQMPPTPMKL